LLRDTWEQTLQAYLMESKSNSKGDFYCFITIKIQTTYRTF